MKMFYHILQNGLLFSIYSLFFSGFPSNRQTIKSVNTRILNDGIIKSSRGKILVEKGNIKIKV